MPGVKNPGLATRRPPERDNPFLSGPLVQRGVTVSNVITSGTTPETMTVAELLTGLLVNDTQDAGTWTLPTAALLVAGLPGIKVGDYIEFSVVNYGDSTLTIGLGTGITKTTIATVAAILTIATLTCKRFRLECTGVQSEGSAADAFVIWTIAAGTAVA